MDSIAMAYSSDNAPQQLVGLFSLEIVGGVPTALHIDKPFCAQLGLDTELSPQQLFKDWQERVDPNDVNAILFAVRNCTAGLKAEAHFRWNHPFVGWIEVDCMGVHAESEGDSYLVRGFFKGSLASEAENNGAEAIVYKNMLTDAMLDSFSVCGLADIQNNEICILKDIFNVAKVLGKNFTYDEWNDTFSALVARDDIENYNEITSRKKLMHYFERTQDERKEEFRCIDPKTKRYRWYKLRVVRFKNQFAMKYKEFFVLRDISEHHHTEFKDSLRIKLINGLTLPYQDIDLVNLKTGRWYSSNTRAGEYAETFGLRGYYDDEVIRYVYLCDCDDEKRRELLGKFTVNRMRERFKAGEKLIECEVRRKNLILNQHEWVRVQAFVSSNDEDGEPHMAIVTIQEINEEKERQIKEKQMLEYALRAERQCKQAILSSSFAVYTYNVTNDVLYDEVIESDGVAPLVPLLGLSCPCSYNEYIRRKSQYITSPTEAEVFRKTLNTATMLDMFKSKRYFFDMEYEFMMEEGKKGLFREAVILTQDLQTNEIWGLTYIKDITSENDETKRIEQAIRDALFQAKRANSAKSLFMSQMSHDIRTPLNSILGMAAIAQEHIEDKERVIDCMNKIEYSGRHLLEIINNVLDLSAIESGKTVLASENFDLGRFIDDTLKLMRPLGEKRGHTLIRDLRLTNTAVKGDSTKLGQLLMNVLSNAMKYTPDGGMVRFTAEELEPDRQDVARYMFTVEDNGIGMSEEFMATMFDPFVRADDRRTTKVEGTGLGMSIALNIARMMNGNINVKSEVGKGSVFEITVCLKRGEAPIVKRYDEISMDEPRKARMSDCNFDGKRVLLAEDLEFNAEIATEFLAQANLITEVAENGARAVEMFAQSPEGYYSLVFMDIQMPELDGYGATRKIRALSRDDAKTVPIIAMTANAFVEDIKKAKEAGMNSHIAKPLDVAKLIAELDRWIK